MEICIKLTQNAFSYGWVSARNVLTQLSYILLALTHQYEDLLETFTERVEFWALTRGIEYKMEAWGM